jgi:hypothetical protein
MPSDSGGIGGLEAWVVGDDCSTEAWHVDSGEAIETAETADKWGPSRTIGHAEHVRDGGPSLQDTETAAQQRYLQCRVGRVVESGSDERLLVTVVVATPHQASQVSAQSAGNRGVPGGLEPAGLEG